MLGAEPERIPDPFYTHRAPPRPSTNGPSMSLGAVMSPPQYPPRPAEYTYKPRSQTPEKLAPGLLGRPGRSGSGPLTQGPNTLFDHPPMLENRAPFPRYGEQAHPPNLAAVGPRDRDDAAERARRTSISGILQRPDSEPHNPIPNGSTMHNGPSFGRPASTNSDGFGVSKAAPERPLGQSSAYDTRPPPFLNPVHQPVTAPTSTPKDNVRPLDRREPQSQSPDFRRVQPVNNEHRSLSSILNADNAHQSHNMMRQDSVQSQSDRSAFGDRYRPRAFSPFAGSVASQTMSVTSMPAEDMARKGSDELSHHRQVLALAADSKKGRYSPVPQAVQGAQAQTPVPDAATQKEHGRVFAGLGGGLGSNNPHGPRPGLAPSPFKSSDGATRLSEENLMKISRSSSGVPKRARKYDDELRAESEAGTGKKGRGNKRSKYAHSYRLDLDEAPRRNTPLSTMNPSRRDMNPSNPTSNPQQLQPRKVEQVPLFKPKKTILISSIITSAKRLPRRHLGNFTYDPLIANADVTQPNHAKFDVSIKPNLLPSFTDADKVNCTYTVRVPKLWLQHRERRLICKECYLWGSGIYTDDSDVVAAATHSGFIKSVAPENVDETLLQRIVKDQNAKIEGLVNVPDTPVEPASGKDAIITLLILPTLDRYTGSSRFGISSRTWPETGKTQHDGVSFAVLKVDFVAGGVEGRRMGRKGVEKRARLKQELRERMEGERRRREMVDKIKQKGKLTRGVKNAVVGTKGAVSKLSETQAVNGIVAAKKPVLGTATATNVNNMNPNVTSAATTTSTKDTLLGLNGVGKEPGEWLRQLESAVD